jgi:hypothetical protein
MFDFGRFVLGCLLFGLLLGLLGVGSSFAQAPWPVPAEIASSHFVVTLNGKSTPVMHAALNNYFLNFEAGRKIKVTVTADSDDFWAKGVEVQPWRFGIRPVRSGRSISFVLDGPAKISISRPGDFLSEAEMLFLFANPKEKGAPAGPAPGLQYFGPGAHRENIDAVAGGAIYLAPGAVVFGSLNVWQVDHVRVFGRGVVVYDGPQNPSDDDGWMHKKNWHCIVMDQAHDVSIEGITCVVRSRTWQNQMKDSRGIRFDNFKTIGANKGNANADGMDWLGGGDTVVHDSFFRAADDVFSMESSWEGYGAQAFAVEGNVVSNVRVEDSVLSTSISNVVRAGWPEKNFVGGGFSMVNSDVIHAGLGGCGIPFALFEFWADPKGRGQSGDYSFENVRMEDWYSLTQVMEPVEGVNGVRFKDVFGLEQPAMIASEVRGKVHGVVLDGVSLGGVVAAKNADVPMMVTEGADEPSYLDGAPAARIGMAAGLVKAGQRVRLEAMGESSPGAKREWSFGDGAFAKGRVVKHRFPDTDGTLLDGSGRFRVLLHVRDAAGRNAWAYQPVVVASTLMPPLARPAGLAAGVLWQVFDQGAEIAGANGVAAGLSAEALGRKTDYRGEFSGFVDVPADGGYVFTLMATDGGSLAIDGKVLATTPTAFQQVCGLAGVAVRPAAGSIALAKGLHRIEVVDLHGEGLDGFRVMWQGPGMVEQEIPAAALFHEGQATATAP